MMVNILARILGLDNPPATEKKVEIKNKSIDEERKDRLRKKRDARRRIAHTEKEDVKIEENDSDE
tara:strand:+ start:107 stop:301 length:195 start_codon:yes stop_codon:yes gene_type:complete